MSWGPAGYSGGSSGNGLPGPQGPQGPPGPTGPSGGGLSGLTTGYLPIATSSSTLGNSGISQSGVLLQYTGNSIFGLNNDTDPSQNMVVNIGGGSNGGNAFVSGGSSSTFTNNNVIINGGNATGGVVSISGCADGQAANGTLNLSAGAMTGGIAGQLTIGNGLDAILISGGATDIQPITDATNVLTVKKANGNVVMAVDTATPAFSVYSNAGTPYFKVDGSAAGGLGAVFVDLSEAGGFFQITNTSYGPSLYVDCGADAVNTGNSAGGTNTSFQCYNGDARMGFQVDNAGRAITLGNTTDTYATEVQGLLSVQPNSDGECFSVSSATGIPLLQVDSSAKSTVLNTSLSTINPTTGPGFTVVSNSAQCMQVAPTNSDSGTYLYSIGQIQGSNPVYMKSNLTPLTDLATGLGTSSVRFNSIAGQTGLFNAIVANSGTLTVEGTTSGAGTLNLYGGGGVGNVNVGYSNTYSLPIININEHFNYIQYGTGNSQYYTSIYGGGNSTGGIYTNFSLYGDTLNLGYNYYPINGSASIPNSAGGTSRIATGYSAISFQIGAVNTAPSVIAQITSAGLIPGVDASFSLGNGSYRWNTVYASNGSINTSSSEYKNNQAPLSSEFGLSFIESLKPISFNWINEPTGPYAGDLHFGFLFQDIEATATALGYDGSTPETSLFLVQEPELEEDGITETPGGIVPTELIPSLVLAVQELSLTNKTLKLEVQEMKKRFDKMESILFKMFANGDLETAEAPLGSRERREKSESDADSEGFVDISETED